ncbi:MAG: hypothetical protein NTU53_13795, partial [Planctomycetota bacterium]|nr:hypothetical protein [Planctomycetota bacterium]
GGGTGTQMGASGGAGGGAIQLTVGGKLTVNGVISANGSNGASVAVAYQGYSSGGGGSGGSVYLTVGTLDGAGMIRVNGGGGGSTVWNVGGGGAGGRIAVYFATNSFSGTTSASGGAGAQYGGAGTIYRKSTAQSFGELLVDNGGAAGATTPLPAAVYALDDLEVAGAAWLQLPTGTHTIDNITVRSGTTLSLLPSDVLVQFKHAQVLAGGVFYSASSSTDHPDDLLEIQPGGLACFNGFFNNAGTISVLGSLIVRPPQDAILTTYTTVFSQLRAGVLGQSVRIWTNVNEDPKPYTAVGSVLNGYPNNPNWTTFAAHTVQKGDVLLKYTWAGDGDFNGVINADDYHRIDSGYITQVGGYYNGDLNYDGVVNADDYFLIDSAYIGQSGPLAAGLPQDVLAVGQGQVKKDGQPSLLATLFSTEPML